MDFGAAIFFTDYSMGPAALGRALEERGFESLWAPEHSHIPLSRASAFPAGGVLLLEPRGSIRTCSCVNQQAAN